MTALKENLKDLESHVWGCVKSLLEAEQNEQWWDEGEDWARGEMERSEKRARYHYSEVERLITENETILKTVYSSDPPPFEVVAIHAWAARILFRPTPIPHSHCLSILPSGRTIQRSSVSSSEDKYLSELEKAQPCSLQDYVYLAAYHLVFGEEDLATEAIRAGYQYADSKLDVIMPIFDLRLVPSKPILEACDLEPIDKSLFLDDILKELSSTSVTTRQRAVRTLGDFYGGKFVTGSKALQAIVKALQHEANSETRTVMIKTLRKDFDYNIDRILNSQDTELVSILQKHGVIDKQVEQTQSSEVGDQVRRKLLAVAILGAVSVLLLMLNPRRSVAFFTMGVGLPIVGSVLVIVGSIIEGPLVGMAVGAIIIGFSVLQVGVKPSEIIYGHSAFQSLVFVLKMLLVGPVTWLVWHLFRHWAMLALIAAGLTGSLLNTLIFRISPFDIGGLFGNWGAILVPTVITLVVGGIWHIEKNG